MIEAGENPVGATRTPVPMDGAPGVERRVFDAWCVWLDALATDAEAALAAAMAYKELDGPARDTWLGALEQDRERVGVPRIAVYAPLLAVESDPERRHRIHTAIGPEDLRATPRTPAYGLQGTSRLGLRVAVLGHLFQGSRGVASQHHYPTENHSCSLRSRPCLGHAHQSIVLAVPPGVLISLAT